MHPHVFSSRRCSSLQDDLCLGSVTTYHYHMGYQILSVALITLGVCHAQDPLRMTLAAFKQRTETSGQEALDASYEFDLESRFNVDDWYQESKHELGLDHLSSLLVSAHEGQHSGTLRSPLAINLSPFAPSIRTPTA